MAIKNANNQEQAQSWAGLAFVWTGAMICIPSLMIGGTLIAGMSFWEAILTALIGNGIIVVLMIFQGIQGSDLKMPAVKAAGQVFGKQGSKKLISIILAISCLGWFGIQANVCGMAFSQFLSLYQIDFPVWLSSIVWGIIMLISALYGIKILNLLNYIAVPVLFVVCLYALVVSLKGDVSQVFQHEPTTSLPFLSGLSITVGSFALGAVIAGDYSQYTKKRGDIVKASILGILPSGIFMIAVGAILAITAGTADVTAVFTKLGLPVIGVIALVLATWTTNAVNAFSGGIAICNIFNFTKSKEKIAVASAGILGTILAAFGILNYFVPIMNILSAMVPPVAGVMIASYWVIQKGDKTKWKEVQGINWMGVTAWAAGAVIACIPVIFSFFPKLPELPNQPLIGCIISFMVYLVGKKIADSRKKQVLEEDF
ncbi:cytosine permease [Listeria kieliensis]